MKIDQKYVNRCFEGFLLLLIIFFTPVLGFSQNDNTANLFKVIKDNPDSLELHQNYLNATVLSTKELRGQYDELMSRYTDNAVIPFALGEYFAQKELPEAKPLLQKAAKLNPANAKAYYYLWIDGERWGDFEKSQAYLRKAKLADPKNPDYAFYYASSFDNTDPEKYKTLSMEVADRFPDNERGAQALYWLAYRSKDKKEKEKYFSQLKHKFPPSDFMWSKAGMEGYFNLLLEKHPVKAINLADEMTDSIEDEGQNKQWKEKVKLAKNVNHIHSFLRNNKPDEATQILKMVKESKPFKRSDYLNLFETEVLEKTGDLYGAYNKIKNLYAKSPKDKFKKVLDKIGAKMGKSESSIEKEVWSVRDSTSEKATDFKLKNYLTSDKTSLADYKGKVILLTYWFPGCGPCRGEFPHFQNVVDDFDGEDLVYLAINITPEQNEYVIPFVESSGYTFIPLEGYKDREKGNLDNGRAAPVNFLIDREGKIVYSHFRVDGNNEDELKNMITSLLNRD